MSTKYELRYTNKQVRGSIRDYALIKYSPLLTIFSPINHHGRVRLNPVEICIDLWGHPRQKQNLMTWLASNETTNQLPVGKKAVKKRAPHVGRRHVRAAPVWRPMIGSTSASPITGSPRSAPYTRGHNTCSLWTCSRPKLFCFIWWEIQA